MVLPSILAAIPSQHLEADFPQPRNPNSIQLKIIPLKGPDREISPAGSPAIVTPAKAGTHGSAGAMADEWIPAFARMTTMGKQMIDKISASGHQLPGTMLAPHKFDGE